MKTIGMIGGMSWESSLEYYRLINEAVRDRSDNKLSSAQILLRSLDFAPIEAMQQEGRWGDATKVLAGAAKSLEACGADFFIITSNTMHLMAPEVAASVKIPFLHIADPTAEAIKAAGIGKVGLLGTKYTMEKDFYKGRLIKEFGLDVIVPDEGDRRTVNRIIYDELCLGEIKDASRTHYLEIIGRLAAQGAQAVILGCTEIGLLVKQTDTNLPLFDTTRLHAEAAVTMALT